MRIRQAQRFIYGTLILILLCFLGSVWGIQQVVHSGTDQSPQTNMVIPDSGEVVFDFPTDRVWADTGAKVFTNAVEQYELSGTFQVYETEEGSLEELRMVRSLALIDDVRSGRQLRVTDGEYLGPFFVKSVGVDEVTLERAGKLFILGLSGETVMRAAPEQMKEEASPPPQRLEDMPALETTRFGKRVSENQWVIDRQEVFSYAEEIMANPLRATQLYRSFSQTAREEGDEAGFAINMKGEKDFFTDMGLGNGDVIRKVNSMQMKTQRRAEFLVREFMKSNMSAVVLDVENNGETRQQIFIVR